MSLTIPFGSRIDTHKPCSDGEGQFNGAAVRVTEHDIEPFRLIYPDIHDSPTPEEFLMNGMGLAIRDRTVVSLDVIFQHYGTEHEDAVASKKMHAARAGALNELVKRYVLVDEAGTEPQPASDFQARTALDPATGHRILVDPSTPVVIPRGNTGLVVKVDEVTEIVHADQLDVYTDAF